MKKILILILVIAGFSILIFRGQKSINIPQKEIIPSGQTVVKTYEDKEDLQGEVIVTVQPLKLGGGENTVFQVSLETHTVELDKDLKNISVMIDNKENEYKPIGWTGGAGGHHISGNLVFPILPEDAKSVKLIIKGIDGFDRNFEWGL